MSEAILQVNQQAIVKRIKARISSLKSNFKANRRYKLDSQNDCWKKCCNCCKEGPPPPDTCSCTYMLGNCPSTHTIHVSGFTGSCMVGFPAVTAGIDQLNGDHKVTWDDVRKKWKNWPHDPLEFHDLYAELSCWEGYDYAMGCDAKEWIAKVGLWGLCTDLTYAFKSCADTNPPCCPHIGSYPTYVSVEADGCPWEWMPCWYGCLTGLGNVSVSTP